jgi:DNA-binding NarL/FixJ family response regulator
VLQNLVKKFILLFGDLRDSRKSFSLFAFRFMAGPASIEFQAARGDDQRVCVALDEVSTIGQTLKMLIGTGSVARRVAVAKHESSHIFPKAEQRALLSGPRGQIPTRLTPRELQVLRLIAGGLHNRQIATRIHRSIKTVEKHRQNLHNKLSTHEVAGLTRYALAIGLMDRSRRGTRVSGKQAKQLTPRELEVLKLVAQGSGNKWIASELQRSIKTVDHHRENIMKKLGIHEVAGLTRYAVCRGLM